MHWENHWTFETAQFVVTFDVATEEMDPSDSFEFEDDIEAVRSGEVTWFCARVQVATKDGKVLATDHLGGCAYKSIEEFYTSHRDPDPMNRNCSIMRAARGENVSICHYFPGMVTGACKEARKALRVLGAINIREEV